MQERHRHGEAGSVDLAAIEAERERLSKVLANYAKKDQFNFDKFGLFGL